MTPSGDHPVIIVGAGVIGLTTAVVLRERGHRVFLLGRELPADATSQHFASVWAGANWCSYAGPNDVREQEWEKTAWHNFMDTRKTRPDLVAVLPFLQFLPTEVKRENLWFADFCPNFRILDKFPDGFGQEPFALSYESLTVHVPHYLQYLVERATRPDSANSSSGPPVEIHRIPNLTSLASILSFLPASYASAGKDSLPIIVNATGLGAHDLTDVCDKSVMPARGQTVLVRAPYAKRCVVHAGKESKLTPKLPGDSAGVTASNLADLNIKSMHDSGGAAVGTDQHDDDPDADQPSYVIPRALSGDVILGGTYQENRWVYEPEEKTTLRILHHCHKICPEIVSPYGEHRYRLAPTTSSSEHEGESGTGDEDGKQQQKTHKKAQGRKCSETGEHSLVWSPAHPDRLYTAEEARNEIDAGTDVVEVLRVNVGLRPARKEGVRSERGTLPIPEPTRTAFPLPFAPGQKRELQLVHAYGLGPAGYQQSWGVAHATANLVVEAAKQA